ncbi:MAG: DHH family phosphoesterase, partial [Lachnospiraceae bacterium]|nr:DHH family phosphoesterase [Lachnospiraceae bacterium]
TDTNSFSELHHPLDKDARDALWFNKSLLSRLRNANLSLEELKIAGVAMIGYEYYEDHHYALIQTDPCDPNILGLISDFCLAVDNIDVVMVYNIQNNGIKFSIRSCAKDAHANEVAEYIAHDIGGGGGHLEKAGGFLNAMLIAKAYPRCGELSENQRKHYYTEILRRRMEAYFDGYDVIVAGEDPVDLSSMQIYEKLPMDLGYIESTDIGKPGEMILIRTLEGDVEMSCSEDMCIMIGVKGDIYPMFKEKFDVSYVKEDGPYEIGNLEYAPKVHNAVTGEVIELLPHAKRCVSAGGVRIYAKKLDRVTKVFTSWAPDNYMYATPDDYLAVRLDDEDDVYIIDQDIFPRSYKLCE